MGREESQNHATDETIGLGGSLPLTYHRRVSLNTLCFKLSHLSPPAHGLHLSQATAGEMSPQSLTLQGSESFFCLFEDTSVH